MNKDKLLQLFDKELRQEIEYPEARKEITSDVVRFVREAPGMNFVSYTYAGESDLDRVDRTGIGLLHSHAAAVYLESLQS